MSCTICQHPQRQKIDQALVAGSATLAALGQQYNLSTSALHRHKAHLQAKVSRAKDQLQDNLRQGCLFWLSQALEIAMATAQAAQAEGNAKIVLQALAHGTRIINLILKQDFQLDPGMVFGILASDQWSTQTGLLPHDPNLLALGRQSLTGTLAAPCPENDPVSPVSTADLDLLQQDLLSLAQQLVQPQPGNRPGQHREKSGKLPGNKRLQKDNNKKNQEDKLYEKISGMTTLLGLPRTVPPETLSPKLQAALQQGDTLGKIPAGIPLSEYLHEQSLQESQAAPKPAPGQSRHSGNGHGGSSPAAA
jgi:hypothetical protein